MNQKESYRARLSDLLDSLEDQILKSSDPEILETIDDDAKKEISMFDGIINNQILLFRRNLRKNARSEYEEAVQNVHSRIFNLPSDIKSKIEVLTSIFQNKQNIPKELTMAFRDGKDLSETDVDSLLQDLADLGILNDDDIGNKE